MLDTELTALVGESYNRAYGVRRIISVEIDRNMIEILPIGVQIHTVSECVGQQCQNKTPRHVP